MRGVGAPSLSADRSDGIIPACCFQLQVQPILSHMQTRQAGYEVPYLTVCVDDGAVRMRAICW